MKLKSLKLENFRQHEDSFIEFSNGITIINGTNGSGKSTILEAITWAIYGTDAARGTKDSIKFNKAKAKAKVRVELVLDLDNELFRVERFLDKAELYLGNSTTPIVTSQQEVTKYLTDKLGMTKDEFFNTYFTGQKELNFLANQSRVERKKFISKVLNYEKIREIQEQIRVDKKSLFDEIGWLKQGLSSDIESIKEDKKQTQLELEEIKKALDTKQKEFNKCTCEFSAIKPEWEKIRENKEKFEKCNIELNFLTDNKKDLEKNIDSLQEKHKNLEEKSKIYAEISKFEDEYKKTDLTIKEYEKLQEKETLKQTYLTKIEAIEKEICEKQLAQEEVIKSGKEKRLLVDKIPLIKSEISSLEEKIKQIETKITSEKKEKEILIAQRHKDIEKIQKQLSLITEKGENGKCPTCERALKDEFEKVTVNFREQISVSENEILKLNADFEKLSLNLPEIKEYKQQKEEKEKELAEYNQIQGEYKNEQDRYLILKKEIEAKLQEKTQIDENLSKLPEGFDINKLNNLREKIVPLKEKYEQIVSLKSELSSFEVIKKELAEVIQSKTEKETRIKQSQSILCELNYSEEQYIRIRTDFEKTDISFQNLRTELIKIEAEKKNINDKHSQIKRTEELNKEKLVLINEKLEKHDLLSELERFYEQFWEKLNNQARPEISELAGKFLVDLTDGRYSELELNDKYEISLLDDGEIKPVISGGEEDLVNLCVRLAISQIIAQRSGKILSLLILDEIFGSLDENRRNNVVNLLRTLINNFEQVILITHIEDIKDEIDNIITIGFDAERGCSKIISN